MNECHLCRKNFSTAWNLSRHDAQMHRRTNTGCYEQRSSAGKDDNSLLMLQYAQNPNKSCSLNSMEEQPPESDNWEVQTGDGTRRKYSTDEGNRSSGCGLGDVQDEEDADSGASSGSQNGGDVSSCSGECGSQNTEPEIGADASSCSELSHSDITDVDEKEESVVLETESEDGGQSTESGTWNSNNEDISGDAEEYGTLACWKINEQAIYLPWKTSGKRPRVIRHKDWLSKLGKEEKGRKRRICEARRSQIDAIREISNNVLHGRVPLIARSWKCLKSYRYILRTLASESTSYKELKRTLLSSRENFLPLLLWLAVPASTISKHELFQS